MGLSQRWRTEAIEAGWGPVEVNDLLGTGRPRGSVDYDAGVWRLPTTWFDDTGTAHQGERRSCHFSVSAQCPRPNSVARTKKAPIWLVPVRTKPDQGLCGGR